MRADERDEQTAAVALADAAEDGTGRPTAAMPSGDPRQPVAGRPQDPRRRPASLLVAKGFSGLTLRAVAAESGANSAMVQYYFGNKDGPRQGDDRLGLPRRPGGRRGGHEHRAAARSVCTGSSTACAPSARRARSASSSTSCPTPCATTGLRARMARAYESYRQHQARLAARRARAVASRGGVAARRGRAHDRGGRRSGHPGGYRRHCRPRRAYAVLEFMLQRSLPELIESGLPAAAAKR